MARSLFQAVFEPEAVALVGASADTAKAASRPQRYLEKHGFKGKIYPVNPSRPEILGRRAVANLRDLPGPVDHAFVMVPAGAVQQVIADCGAARIPVVTVFSDGFADIGGEGQARQDALVAEARKSGVRLIGPNSMGVIDAVRGMTLTVNTVLDGVDLVQGSMALISQSGSMIGSLLARAQARGMGFSRLVSVGNEADLSVGEIVDLLVDDPATKSILLFLEALRGAPTLAKAARRAFDAGKPVIAYKLGRSEIGRSLAATHSGALAGPRENVSAYFRHHGIVDVECMESLFECPPLLASGPKAKGRTVAVVTPTGGAAAMVADRLGLLGAKLMETPEPLVARLRGFGLNVSAGHTVDLTAAGTKKEIYQAALEDLVTRDCDAIVAIIGSSGMFHPEHAVDPIKAVAGRGKPIAVFVAPEAPATLEALTKAGIAAFRTPESCADAVMSYLNWVAPRPAPAPASEKVAALLQSQPPGILGEADARHVFEAIGIAQARTQLISDPGQAHQVRLAFPVAAKIASADISHKSEAGGVRLNINDAEDLEKQATEMLKRIRGAQPQAKIDGILVQEMQSGLAEAIVGFKRDEEVGPVVILGLGGVLAEIYRDVAVRLAPVDEAEAMRMIAEVKGLAPIRGYRNAPKGDCQSLASAIVALSQLGVVARLKEAEINPLIVKAEGQDVVAVDALISLGPKD
jgi:acyl-CoA synthetase (NDP forming)